MNQVQTRSVWLLLPIIGGCVAPTSGDGSVLSLSHDDHALFDALGVADVRACAGGETGCFSLVDADHAERGFVHIASDGLVTAELDTARATFVESDDGIALDCAGSVELLERDADSGEWRGLDAHAVSERIEACAAPLEIGRRIDAAVSGARTELAGDEVAGRSEALIGCNWALIGDVMDQYSQMCQSWGYDQGIFRFNGCRVSLLYCIHW